MLFLALLVPPLLLCAVLGLARYEEYVLGPSGPGAQAPRIGPPHAAPPAGAHRRASGRPAPSRPGGRHRRSAGSGANRPAPRTPGPPAGTSRPAG